MGGNSLMVHPHTTATLACPLIHIQTQHGLCDNEPHILRHTKPHSSGVPPPQTLVQYNNIITVRQAELAFMLRRLPSFIKRQVGAELGEDPPLSSIKVAEGWCTRAELHFIL